MKKLMTVILILIAAAGAAADTDLDPEDFLYITPFNRTFYPELDYRKNPAVLTDVDEKMLLGNLVFKTAYNSQTKTRIDDSIGAAGGTNTESVLDINPSADFIILGPGKDRTASGFSMDFQYNYFSQKEADIKYNGASENLQAVLSDTPFDIGADFFLASQISKGVSAGGSLGYSFGYDPALFRWITDSTVSPASSYTEALSTPDNYNDYTHGIDAAFGFIFPQEKVEISLSIDYQGRYTDSSDRLVEVDTDGDGYNDQVYKYYAYLGLPAESGGPSDAVTGMEFVNFTFDNNLDLNAGLIWNFDRYKSMILSGSWKALGLNYSHYADNIITEVKDTDVSYLDKYYSYGLTSFDANLAFDIYNREKKQVFRIGGGYSLHNERFTQEGDTDAGTMLFSSRNEGNYPELNLGLEPENNSLADSEIYPDSQLIHKIVVDACWRWTPEKKVTLFIDLGARAYLDSRIYRAFNLDTLTVWEEESRSLNIDWIFGTAAGISFPLGEKLSCMVNLSNLGASGDFSFADESHMYDSDIQRVSENGLGICLIKPILI